MKYYTAIKEYCDDEGEVWVTFIPSIGNEEFISTFKNLCKLYKDDVHDIGDILVYDKQYTETEVDFTLTLEDLLKINGYDTLFKKVDKIFNPSSLIFNDVEDFINFYYKRNLFK